jgi:hypothetical protein
MFIVRIIRNPSYTIQKNVEFSVLRQSLHLATSKNVLCFKTLTNKHCDVCRISPSKALPDS